MALHLDRGPYLVGAWYRAPDPGNTKGMDSLREELENLKEEYRHCAGGRFKRAQQEMA